jgi:hypothetical protein
MSSPHTQQETNFLRDQSGMKRQLSTLQQLIRVMDPQLYAHLGQSFLKSTWQELTFVDKTDSLNLFFCFRWILIAFKREFSFTQVIRLWDVRGWGWLCTTLTVRSIGAVHTLLLEQLCHLCRACCAAFAPRCVDSVLGRVRRGTQVRE